MNSKKKAIIPSRIEMSIDEVVSLQQSIQEILFKGETISNHEIYAKILKMFIMWAKIESHEYGTEMRPLDEIEYIIGLMKSDKLKVELIANV